ncbi:hypothetical protein FS749_010412, partial [Ceratobasidium sp. UAMH 11750]
MFLVGEFTKPIAAEDIVYIQDSAETEKLLPGTICSKWERIFEWDEHCVKASELEEWRQIADPYCDDALRETFPSANSSTGIDLLGSVERQAAQGPGPARDFMNHVTSLPPENIRASHAQILRAQTFFYTYYAPILAALMHFSLAGGFASARITRVLHSVSYLVPGKSDTSGEYSVTQATNDRTFKRLLETLQMILDVMGGSAALAELEGHKTSPANAA